MIFDENKIVNAGGFAENAKASVQRSGRLGLSNEAAKLLKPERNGSVLIANGDDGNLGCVVLPPNSGDSRGFRWQCASGYFSANLRLFFDSIGLDYSNTDVTTIFDIVQTEEKYMGFPVFKLRKRLVKRRSSKKKGGVDTQTADE
jgi:hypothetical protein